MLLYKWRMLYISDNGLLLAIISICEWSNKLHCCISQFWLSVVCFNFIIYVLLIFLKYFLLGYKTLKYSYYLLFTSEYLIMIFQMKPPFFHFELKLQVQNPCSLKLSIPHMYTHTHTLNLSLSNGGGRRGKRNDYQ